MGFEADDEILQDFLTSSQEILESLDKQLVELEQRPQDKDLLNAVFRGFHTIKGGAGFLSLTPLIELCHRAEDVFNLLRKGECAVTPTLMDVVLRALDAVNEMFARLNAKEAPDAADPALLAQLEQLSKPRAAEPVVNTPPAVATVAAAPATGDITDAEFDQLLDALQGENHSPKPQPASPAAAPPAASGDITDAEFEALLDQLHAGQTPSDVQAPMADTKPEPRAEVPRAAPVAVVPEPADRPAPSAARPAAAPVPEAQAETTVRVDTRRLDDMMNMVGELVLVRNRLSNLQTMVMDEKVAKAVADLSMVTSDLQSVVMKTRMQPIKKVYGKFPRVVRDVARALNKEVELVMRGEETEVDKNLVEILYDPLVHLVRNSIDHGVEPPDRRVAAGKSRAGRLELTAEQAGDHILLAVADDGAGMDPDVLRRKAVEKGLYDEESAARLTTSECYNLIFLPGFSTKSVISDVSGRGVGMDVVRTKISQINGTIEIDSTRGQGTRISIKVPLTLAIMPTLMVTVGSQIFALPLASVIEILDMNLDNSHVIDKQEMIVVRDKTLPLFYLRHWLVNGAGGDPLPSAGHVVIAQAGNQRVGLVVDQLVGQEEVVIKPLGAWVHGTPGLAGATITGDGRIALIVDLPALVRRYARRAHDDARGGRESGQQRGSCREVA
jgi:two-component system chemotaxis sensor kinase CheA